MSYSASTMLDDNKPPPDPRYQEWDKRSRKQLAERLYEAVDKRRDNTEALIPRIIGKQLDILGINSMKGMTDEALLKYRISLDNIIKITYQCIDKQIADWKGLRWWRFDEKNVCDSWNKWFKKSKCWQDQNQYKPLGRFWCLIFDELNEYISNIANNKFSNNTDYANILQRCLYIKCIEAILKGQVQFQRTRQTPLLPIRVLTESKELQEKLNQIDNGFTLLVWKREAVKAHKIQKQSYFKNTNTKNNRSNVATLLNEKCSEYATNAYHQAVQSLNQIIPSLHIDFAAIENDSNNNSSSIVNKVDCSDCSHCVENNAYGPVHDGVSNILRVESQRYSPTSTSNSMSDMLSLSDGLSIGSNRNYHYNNNNQRSTQSTTYSNDNASSKLEELSMENQELKRELASMKEQLFNKKHSDNDILQNIVQQMAMQHRFQIMMAQRFLTPDITSPIPPNMPPHIPPNRYYEYMQYAPNHPSMSTPEIVPAEMAYNSIYDDYNHAQYGPYSH